MDISVVLPIYNEKENLVPLLDELEGVLAGMGKEYEVIAVDDGSNDGSVEVLRLAASERKRIKALFFRRNCGQAAAFDAGFRAATGDVVVTMDADRQNDPADIPAMLAKLDDGFDLVTGWRKDRKDGFATRKLPSRIANFIIRRLTGTRIHDLGCSLKVYRKQVTNEMRLYGEMHRFISVLAEGIGARVGEVVVNHRPRVAGHTKYGLARTVKVLLDLTTVWFMRRYQTKPIYVFGGLGVIMVFAAVTISGVVLYEKLADGTWVHRNPLFLIAITCFLMGMQSIGTGILAELLVRTYFESQSKTPYSIASRAGFEQEN
ncbi:MAG TPA: glycosyltransferase family 2 protein [Polyangiaceae bacterium]|jgi:glycosyltransferase involved in cell wall biosynthesis|nr:glycosyltransferase family 2 protein [Polyangiaceae bacterium]